MKRQDTDESIPQATDDSCAAEGAMELIPPAADPQAARTDTPPRSEGSGGDEKDSEEVLCQCDMSEELSRQLEDILSTYCMGSTDGPTLANGQSHSPELNGQANEYGHGGKARKGGQGNCSGGCSGGGGGGDGKEPKKTQEKKKVKGLGKDGCNLVTIVLQ